MISYWERESFTRYDVVVIGAGIVGLSAAYSIKKKHPRFNILVLERGLLPSGASTKNAGFTTFGGVGEMLHDLELMGENDLLNLVEMRWKGLELLRQRLGDDNIDYQQNGGYELFGAGEAFDSELINKINNLLLPIFSQRVFSRNDSFISKFGFNSKIMEACIFNPLEGQIDSGKMMKNYLRLNMEIGNILINGAQVEHIDKNASDVTLQVMIPNSNAHINFIANQVVVCNNAFAKSFFPEFEIIPGRGQVLITKPIKGLLPKGIFHFDNGYYYFRNIDGRLLFGGGRNLDFENETTTAFGSNNLILQNLQEHLRTWILPGIPFEIDLQWSGIMAFGSDKKPIIKRVNENLIVGVRMNGMGVAIGSEVGRIISEMI